MSTLDPTIGAVVTTSKTTPKNAYKAETPIIRSPTAARTIYENLRSRHIKRINLYKEIESLIQGSPPYDPKILRAAGLEHVANFNDMSARAVFERACLAYWNLLHNTEKSVKFEIRLKDEFGNSPPELPKFAEIMARNWDYAVKEEWPSFTVNFASVTSQLVKFGVSPVIFPDERSPKWRMVELNRFFVPDQAQADIDTLGTLMVETEFTLSYLWGVFEKFKNKPQRDPDDLKYLTYTDHDAPDPEQPADESPWNIDELGKLLVHITNQNQSRDNLSSDAYDLQRKILSGDVSFENSYNDTVKLISFFQREFEGQISHYIFHRELSTHDFLYKVENQYTNLQQAVIIFTMNPGEYTIHSNRGIGHKIFSLAQAKIQAGCAIVDQVKWASTPIIKSSGLHTKDAEQIKFYPGVPTNIGTCELQQNNLGANVQNSVTAAQYLTSQIQYNISYSGQDPASPDPDQASISPSQSRLMANKEFSVLKNFIMHFQATVDHLVRNMTATMLNAKEGWPDYEIAKLWKTRCIEDGVPEEIFDMKAAYVSKRTGMPSHICVKATRVAGAGSQVAELMGLQELQAIVGSFGPKEESAFKRRFISATIGHESVEEFMQDDASQDEHSGGASLAAVENAIMQAGQSPVFSPENDQRAHFSVHMALAQNTIQKLQQQQMDVVEADSVFTVLVPHLEEHMQALAKNVFAQQFYATAQPAFNDVERYATLNRKNAAKMAQARIKQQQEQQAQQQQVLTQEELKNMQTINDERRKDLKLAAQTHRQEEAGQAKEEALARKTDADIRTKQQKTNAEVEAIARKATANQSSSQLSSLTNTASQKLDANPRQVLRDSNGVTPAPYDLEKPR